jgi:hypothetical protein
MTSVTNIARTEIWHKNYNLDKKDTLNELPAGSAVFGVFGIVNEEPVNCRYVSATDNLQEAVRQLFETPDNGLKKFMQGPWIKMLQYELIESVSAQQTASVVDAFVRKFKPKIDEDGEYPGYYD